MIPRYDGLVPAIRGPTSSARSTAPPVKTGATTTVQRYVIRPTQISAANSPTSAAAATHRTADGSASGEHERRLYTFMPSADVAAPPRELRVAAFYFGDVEPSSSSFQTAADATRQGAADSAGAFDAFDASGDDGEDDEDGEANGSPASGSPQRPQMQSVAGNASIPASAPNAPNGKSRRRRRRGREPVRLQYQGIMDRSSHATMPEKVAKMASTPVAAYRHLACVLLDLPTTWRDAPCGEEGSAPPASLAPLSNLIAPTALGRPVLQLWGERKEADDSVAGISGGARTGTGISSTWSSAQSTRISKSDWKTMDAADADMHKRTNWSDDDGGDDTGDGVETALAVRERKRAKAEATSHAVRSFLKGTRAALQQQQRQQHSDSEDDNLPRPVAEAKAQIKPPQMPPPAISANSALKGTVVQRSISTPVANENAPRRLVLSPKASAPVVVTAQKVAAPSAPTPTTTTTNIASAAKADAQSGDDVGRTTAATKSEVATPTLPSLAELVLREVRQTEGRAAAPLMELQKRILKQLPDFPVMNQKIKSPATKKEAVEWFQACQRELRVWLQGQGHIIASDGAVTFTE